MSEGLVCYRHPNVPTSLRCSRCERPVCVRCMVYTPVGIRCGECARERRSGINAPSTSDVARSAAWVAPLVAVAAMVWGLFPAYAFWLALIVGFAGGEIISLGARRRRGPVLQFVAGASVILILMLALAVQETLGARTGGSVAFQTVMAALALVLAVIRQR